MLFLIDLINVIDYYKMSLIIKSIKNNITILVDFFPFH